MITPENKAIKNFRERQFNNFVQLTMPYLAGFISEAHYEITLIDEYNQQIPYDQDFDLVAITVNTPNADHCYRMAGRFRKAGAKVVLGGPHVTLLPEEAKLHSDYLVVGEAENTWPLFLDDFYQDRAQDIYEDKEMPVLSNLPFPRRDLIKGRLLTQGAVFATRGCPYECSYCNLKQIYCNKFRTRPVSEVIADIQKIRGKHFVFWDDNFFGDPAYAKELLRELAKLNKRWAAQVTIDKCTDPELLCLARQAGCIYLFLGLESFSAEGLASVNKGLNHVERYQNTLDTIHRYGLSIQAGIIFGLDTDSKETFARTLQACETLGIEGATVSILTPFPRTPVYYQMKNTGRLLAEKWESYNGKTEVAFAPSNMTAEELYQGYMWFRQQFYSLRSISKRLLKSKTNLLYNLAINIGYKISI